MQGAARRKPAAIGLSKVLHALCHRSQHCAAFHTVRDMSCGLGYANDNNQELNGLELLSPLVWESELTAISSVALAGVQDAAQRKLASTGFSLAPHVSMRRAQMLRQPEVSGEMLHEFKATIHLQAILVWIVAVQLSPNRICSRTACSTKMLTGNPTPAAKL